MGKFDRSVMRAPAAIPGLKCTAACCCKSSEARLNGLASVTLLARSRNASETIEALSTSDLCAGQLHRSDTRNALFPDRRVEIRQTDHRSSDYGSHVAGGSGEVRVDLDGFDAALQPLGRPPDRSSRSIAATT